VRQQQTIDFLLDQRGRFAAQDDLLTAALAEGEPGERYVLCRSGARAEKERAMLRRQSERLTQELIKIDAWLRRSPQSDQETVGRRIGRHLGKLPKGYDHKYIYSHLGYNLKPLDPQAAIGRKQLQKLPAFIAARQSNWQSLRAGMADLADVFEFNLTTHAISWSSADYQWGATGCRTTCSWFGFMLRVKPTAPFTHVELGRHLDKNRIGNRMLFSGNLLCQPVFVQLKRDRPQAFRVVGAMSGADEIMNQAIFIGTYPGLTPAMIDYELDTIRRFVRKS
jgi:CDP-6-deoxy-D-xylo-4-hexulose-3-dehydrase